MATLELDSDSDNVEQYSRRSNLRFSGIPETDNEVEDTTEKILQIINNDMEVPVSRDQVERSHRLGPNVDRNGKARQRNIIIRFNRDNLRQSIQGKVQPENQKQRWSQEGLRKRRSDCNPCCACISHNDIEKRRTDHGLLDSCCLHLRVMVTKMDYRCELCKCELCKSGQPHKYLCISGGEVCPFQEISDYEFVYENSYVEDTYDL